MIGRHRAEPGGGARPQVTVYTRVGCGLCRRAEGMVTTEARRAEISHVDVDSDPDLQIRFGVRVPVVTVDGVEVAELELAPGTVRRAVRVARAARRNRGDGQALGTSGSEA